MGNLLFDMAFQKRLLHDDVNIKFTFTPQNADFCMFSGKLSTDFSLVITKAAVQIPRVDVRPSASLPKGEISYFYVEHELVAIPVSIRTSNFNKLLLLDPFREE